MAIPAIVPVIATVAASAVSAYGAVQSGQAQARQARYNAAVQQRDAEQQALLQERTQRIAPSQAAQERAAAAFEAGQLERQAQHAQARQRALVGASGVELSGSPLMAYLDNVRQHELEANVARYGGEMRARQVQDEAQLAGFQARQLRQSGRLALTQGGMQASSAARTGAFSAGATLLTGAASAADRYTRLQRLQSPYGVYAGASGIGVP